MKRSSFFVGILSINLQTACRFSSCARNEFASGFFATGAGGGGGGGSSFLTETGTG